MKQLLWQRIEKVTAILSVLALLLSMISLDLLVVGGVFTGAIVGWINLKVLTNVVGRSLKLTHARNRVLLIVALKFVLLLGLIAAIILVLRVNVLGFLLGYSCLVISVATVSLLEPLFPVKKPESEVESNHDEHANDI